MEKKNESTLNIEALKDKYGKLYAITATLAEDDDSNPAGKVQKGGRCGKQAGGQLCRNGHHLFIEIAKRTYDVGQENSWNPYPVDP